MHTIVSQCMCTVLVYLDHLDISFHSLRVYLFVHTDVCQILMYTSLVHFGKLTLSGFKVQMHV